MVCARTDDARTATAEKIADFILFGSFFEGVMMIYVRVGWKVFSVKSDNVALDVGVLI